MVARLEVMSIAVCIDKMKVALPMQDWATIEQSANKLQGSSAYIGAGKVHYACYYIQAVCANGNYKAIEDFYPLLIEACIEFKRFSRKFLAEYHSKCFIAISYLILFRDQIYRDRKCIQA